MFYKKHFPLIAILMLFSATLACSRFDDSGDQVFVTATPEFAIVQPSDTPSLPTSTPITPTPDPTRDTASFVAEDGTYVVQPGDTLAIIAAGFGTTVEAFATLNNLTDVNVLEVGQVLQVPSGTVVVASTDGNKLIPDSELVYGPSAANFDIAAYIKLKSGFLRVYSEELGGELWTGVELIHEIAMHFSVNPRLLLALLEYQSGWLTESTVSVDSQTYPMGLVNSGREKLFRQIRDTADLLNAGYYGWRYRGMESVILLDGSSVVLAPDLNAGTAALHYFFAQASNNRAEWDFHVSENGFFQTYLSLFGDPFHNAIEPLVPNNMQQPAFAFPFPQGEVWFYTGGPHGAYDSGSAWAAVDFAPPEPPENIASQGSCYLSPNYVTAVAPGVIARSGDGYVVLDLDFDGNEHTGWNVVYLHVDSRGVIPAGTRVETGDHLGNPSCEGGVSSGTHLHISRRYNGEWIPANCVACAKHVLVPSMSFGGWIVRGIAGREYQGTMSHVSGTLEDRRAEVGRLNTVNQVSY